MPMLRRASIRSAAEPVTIGAAPDVPPNAAVPVKLPDMADTDAPGAPISGLTQFVFEGTRRADLGLDDVVVEARTTRGRRRQRSDQRQHAGRREPHDGIAGAQHVAV